MSRTTPKNSIAAWSIASGRRVHHGLRAIEHAAHWYRHPFAGVLVTADGNVSSIGMPTWSGIEQGLRFPDRLALDRRRRAAGVAGGVRRAATWDRAVDDADRARTPVGARARRDRDGEREVDLRLAHLDAASWWLYGGTTIFMGALYALAAFIALSSSPRGALARTFAKFAALRGALLPDVLRRAHDARRWCCSSASPSRACPSPSRALALRLPDDVPLHRAPPVAPRASSTSRAWRSPRSLVAARRDRRAGHALPERSARCSSGARCIFFVVLLGLRYARAQRDAGARPCASSSGRPATPYVLVGARRPRRDAQLARVDRGVLRHPGARRSRRSRPAVVFVRHDLLGQPRPALARPHARRSPAASRASSRWALGAAFAASLGVPFRGALVGALAGALIVGAARRTS